MFSLLRGYNIIINAKIFGSSPPELRPIMAAGRMRWPGQ